MDNPAEVAPPAGDELLDDLTPEQREAWVSAMKPVWDQFAGDVGQDMIDAAQAINAGM